MTWAYARSAIFPEDVGRVKPIGNDKNIRVKAKAICLMPQSIKQQD